ncbi:MAG: hypothetical protein JO309_03750 [Pseudonocardiales bacterium]|nr:hypothetical protein [Pseudonocardiales bacterium]MBV9728524.1 hypothetical protein [Pseudonocardiales bacterium]
MSGAAHASQALQSLGHGGERGGAELLGPAVSVLAVVHGLGAGASRATATGLPPSEVLPSDVARAACSSPDPSSALGAFLR